MQFFIRKKDEKLNRRLTIAFSLFLIIFTIIFSIGCAFTPEKELPVEQKTEQQTIEKPVNTSKETLEKGLLGKMTLSAKRNQSLTDFLKKKNISYIVNGKNEVLTAEKTATIINDFEFHKRINRNFIGNVHTEKGITMETLMGEVIDTYSCCKEDDSVICTLYVYENFIKYEENQENGSVNTVNFILIRKKSA